MIYGITGKIGSGKHTAAKILEKNGFFLIDADKLAHELYIRGSDIWHKLVDCFGKKIIGKNYEIDRAKLGTIVFNDSDKLKELNSIVHPELQKSIKNRIAEANIQHHENIVIVAALANELKLKSLVNKLILITAPIEQRIKRLQESRKIKDKEIVKRNNLQEDVTDYDLLIQNTESLDDLKEKLNQIV